MARVLKKKLVALLNETKNRAAQACFSIHVKFLKSARQGPIMRTISARNSFITVSTGTARKSLQNGMKEERFPLVMISKQSLMNLLAASFGLLLSSTNENDDFRWHVKVKTEDT